MTLECSVLASECRFPLVLNMGHRTHCIGQGWWLYDLICEKAAEQPQICSRCCSVSRALLMVRGPFSEGSPCVICRETALMHDVWFHNWYSVFTRWLTPTGPHTTLDEEEWRSHLSAWIHKLLGSGFGIRKESGLALSSSRATEWQLLICRKVRAPWCCFSETLA